MANEGMHTRMSEITHGAHARRRDDEGATALVYSANLARRQLNKSQLALVGAKLKAWHAVRAKERQLEAIKAGNKTRHGRSPVPKNSSELAIGDARDHAARTVGVSVASAPHDEQPPPLDGSLLGIGDAGSKRAQICGSGWH